MSKLLIIDDDELVREELRDRIISMGHESEEAGTVQQSLEKLNRTAFDCVLLDLAIPVALEGRSRIEHGLNLLRQIVAMPDAPPVIVITSHGLDSHMLAISAIDIGATTFAAKPFTDDPIEPKITMVLERRAAGISASAKPKPKAFQGGTLALTGNGIELCGEPVGGGRKDASIRQIVKLLSVKGPERYQKMSGAELADAIGGSVTPATVANAVKAFRKRCQRAVAAQPQEVITSTRGGGYRLADWIVVRFDSEFSNQPSLEADKAAVLRVLRKHGQCPRAQIASESRLPEARLAAAMDALDNEGGLMIRGSGSGTVYSVKGAPH